MGIVEAEVYKIKTGNFEGPLGLLLELVESRKLFINDVSLAAVTEDYLGYVKRIGEVAPSEVSSFIVVAATLILIKSKSLLPNLTLSEGEKEDIRSLEERLRLYQLFTELSQEVKKSFGKRIIFPAEERKNNLVVFLPDSQITRESMMTFAQSVIGALPKAEILPEVEVRKVISLEEMIEKLSERIQDAVQINFREFSGKAGTREEKVTVIVGFLAMLELVRQGVLNAIQENHGEDILISRKL